MKNKVSYGWYFNSPTMYGIYDWNNPHLRRSVDHGINGPYDTLGRARRDLLKAMDDHIQAMYYAYTNAKKLTKKDIK